MRARRVLPAVLAALCASVGGLLLAGAPARAATAHEFLGSFGPGGPGSGAFEEPQGVAVEQSSGDVYVYEGGKKGRVYKFNAAGEPEDFSSSASNVIEDVGSESPGEDEIAVDSSSGPDRGDIYLATGSKLKIYGSSGVELGTLTGKEPCGVAVDPSGAVYVMFYGESAVKRYIPVKNPVKKADYTSSLSGVEEKCDIAADSAGDIYAAADNPVDAATRYEASQFSALEVTAIGTAFGIDGRSLAVDPSTGGEVYIDESKDIAEYESSGTRVGAFGESKPGELSSSIGVAVSHSSGYVYAANRSIEAGEVDIYAGSATVVLPVVSVEGVSGPGTRSVTLNGTVDPEETSVTACEFEYGTGVEYGQSVPCSEAVPFSGDSPVAVSASVDGLTPGTTYYFRLVATNANGASGIARSTGRFTTAPPGVKIDEESVANVSSTSAELQARIDPRGAETTYYFQYGPTTSYGLSIPVPPGVDIGSGETDESVVQQAQGLAPSSTSHYRVVAIQGSEVLDGPDHTFTTPASGSGFVLPDGREWEMVSPPDKDGAEPWPTNNEGGLIQASADGDAITYIADGPMPAGAEPEGSRSLEPTQILSTRGSVEWSSQDIATPNSTGSGLHAGSPVEYQFFSPDLVLALVEPFPGAGGSGSLADPPLSPPLSPAEEGHQEKTIYLRDDAPLQPEASEAASYEAAKHNGELMKPPNSGYLALVSKANAPGGAEFGDGLSEGGEYEGVEVSGAAPDLSHAIFTSRRAAPGLYEWGPKGDLQLISVLPGAEEKRVEADLGGTEGDDVRHAISNDGTLVFWTLAEGGKGRDLYVRDTETRETLQLDTAQPGSSETKEEQEKKQKEWLEETSKLKRELERKKITKEQYEEAIEKISEAQLEEKPHTPQASFQTASADGAKVFFTDQQRLTAGSKAIEGAPDLYVAELSGGSAPGSHLSYTLTDLTPEGVDKERADVQATGSGGGVLGAGEDGSSVYFVANGALAPEATQGDCVPGEPSPGETCNLYVRHFDGAGWTAPKLIAALSSEDEPDWGDGEPNLVHMTSRVSPNGEHLAFMSDESLTGYDNIDVNEATGRHADEEVYLYDASSEHLLCASCDPTGERPAGVYDGGSASNDTLLADRLETWSMEADGGRWLAGSVPGWTPTKNQHALYQSRYLSDSGRLFFDSPDHLVPAATSDEEKVYEYEPTGVGSCESEGGCVGLISSGHSEHESAFLDASESGNDVFFLTADRLVPQDVDESYDVYDARVCEASSPCLTAPSGGSSPVCETAAECRPGSFSSPAFAPPASTTSSGAGDAVQQGGVLHSQNAKPKPLTRAQKLATALKACRKDKKKKRVACERKARKQYGPTDAKKARKSSGKGRQG